MRHLALLFRELNDASFHFSLSLFLPGEILKMISDLAALFLFKREAISIFSFVNQSSARPGQEIIVRISPLPWSVRAVLHEKGEGVEGGGEVRLE